MLENSPVRFPILQTQKSPEFSGLFRAHRQGTHPTQNVWRWAQSKANPAQAAFPINREIYREFFIPSGQFSTNVQRLCGV